MNRNALPDDDLEINRATVEGESALDAFEFEPAASATAGQSTVDDDPMDFFADEDPVPGILELPAELSNVSSGVITTGAVVRAARHVGHARSHASAEALVLTVIVMGVFTTMLLFSLIRDQESPAALIASTDVAPIAAVARPVTPFLARPIVQPQDLPPTPSTVSRLPESTASRLQEAVTGPTRPQPDSKTAVVARPTIRGLTPPVSSTLSPEPVRRIESPDAVISAPPAPAATSAPAAAPDPVAAAPAPSREIANVPVAPKASAPEAIRASNDADVIQRVLARYRAAFNVLDSSAAKAVWPSVDTRALGRAFERLEAQSLVFENCDVAVTGAQASATCNGTASYVPKVGHRASFVESRHWRFELKKSGTEWVIDQVDAR